MIISTIQTNPSFGMKEANTIEALTLMRSVEADVYVLPELFASGYHFASAAEAASLAEAFKTGPTFTALTQFAEATKSFVVFGFAETDNGTLYNSSAIVGYDGTCVLYRKVHLFDREKLFFAPGNLEFTVVTTPVARIGMMICFDWYFPESARTLALKGAQLIAHPSNLVLPHCPNSMPVRSLENRVFTATANRVGADLRPHGTLSFIGQSQITSPMGEILHRSSATCAEAARVTIEPGRADNKSATERNNLFADRRPDFYA